MKRLISLTAFVVASLLFVGSVNAQDFEQTAYDLGSEQFYETAEEYLRSLEVTFKRHGNTVYWIPAGGIIVAVKGAISVEFITGTGTVPGNQIIIPGKGIVTMNGGQYPDASCDKFSFFTIRVTLSDGRIVERILGVANSERICA